MDGIKKIKKTVENGFFFDEIEKLTIKDDSNISNINIHYSLNLPMPIFYRQFFRKFSQNPESIKSVCNDLNKSFEYACRRWIVIH